MHTNTSAPLLSIGLPVYNGSLHLREAIESLLAQDVDSLELVICDNASTDDTAAICADFARIDPRVRYTRNLRNIGAAQNFNRAFELCSGAYFMWGSDDDIWAPEFARTCISRLAEHSGAVLCTSQVQLVGDDGLPKSTHYEVIDTSGMSLEARVHELLRRPVWYDMYSVFRPEVLRRTGLYSPSYGGDVHLLLELLLIGDFLSVPETLLRYRIPDTLKTAGQMTAEIGVSLEENLQRDEPRGFLARDLANMVRASGLPDATVNLVLDDFVGILSSRESSWGREILRERGWIVLPGARITEREIRSTLAPQEQGSGPPDFRRRFWKNGVRIGRWVKRLGRAIHNAVTFDR